MRMPLPTQRTPFFFANIELKEMRSREGHEHAHRGVGGGVVGVAATHRTRGSSTLKKDDRRACARENDDGAKINVQ